MVSDATDRPCCYRFSRSAARRRRPASTIGRTIHAGRTDRHARRREADGLRGFAQQALNVRGRHMTLDGIAADLRRVARTVLLRDAQPRALRCSRCREPAHRSLRLAGVRASPCSIRSSGPSRPWQSVGSAPGSVLRVPSPTSQRSMPGVSALCSGFCRSACSWIASHQMIEPARF